MSSNLLLFISKEDSIQFKLNLNSASKNTESSYDSL
jgi:hypothetical protein